MKVVRQEDRGFGAGAGRATPGVRAAAHDIVVFLDGDMLPEGGLAGGARAPGITGSRTR